MLVSNFPSIVKDELAVLQQRAAVQKTAETRITYDTLLATVIYFIILFISFTIFSALAKANIRPRIVKPTAIS